MNIKELAKKIGVSSATVSRVINNNGYISDETRNKVMEGIEKYSYVPNAIARSLSTKDTHSIGVIIPDIENEYFSSVISGINEVAERNGYCIYFMGSNENIQTEHRFLDVVQQQCLAGVIITPVSENDQYTRERLLKLNKEGIPTVLIDRDIQGVSLDGVFVDNARGAYEGVWELIKAGHTEIAIIRGPETSKPGKERFKGYKMAMDDAGIILKDEYIVSGDFKIQKAYECTKELLELEYPPTAIFSSNNLTTLGCIKYITEKGMKIGEDISIIGFDEIEILNIVQYNLSVITRDAKFQGGEAMRLMLENLQKRENNLGVVRKNIPFEIILRGSEKIRDKKKKVMVNSMSENVMVFGSFVVDLMGRTPHLPVAGETVKGSMFKMGPGGKGFNQGVAAHKAGAKVQMVTKIGMDTFAEVALNEMEKLGMEKSSIFQTKEVETGCALILVDENTSQNEIVVILGACNTITDEEVESLENKMEDTKYLLTQLETNVSSIYKVIDMAYERKVKVILNTAPVQVIDQELYKKVFLITPNEVETEILTGIAVESKEKADLAANWFFERGVENVLITLGSRGVYLATKEKREIIPAYKVKAIDTTGAGDAFNGGLVAALAEGKDLWEATKFANALAAVAVQRIGTTPAMPTRDEVEEFILKNIEVCL